MNTKSFWTTALAGLAMATGLVACGGGSDDVEATTANGVVRGSISGNTISYKGIPYAAPPVGARRWAAPAAPANWSGVRDAKSFAPHCPQAASPFGSASTNEDCLYLNVYTPKAPGNYPVFVWIHGGAFYLGLSDGYDPTKLVNQGLVVVTLNYRLGALGFMSHALLSAEQGGTSGNYGLMDQQAALRWVRANIANFGGNRDNITIAGESAGGFSVHSHVASAGSAGLFHKAIAMSAAYPFGAAQDSLAVAQAKGASVVTTAATIRSTATGTTVPACSDLTCMRNLPVSVLLGAQMTPYPSGPVPSRDGVVLTQDVRTTIAAGTHNRVPMIEGTTRDEWRLFAALDELTATPPMTQVLTSDADHIAKVTALLGGALNPAAGPTATAMVNGFYPAANYGGSATLAYGALGTDMIFACNGRIAALELQQHRAVYAYEFRDRTAPSVLPHRATLDLGAPHTSELQYIFNMAGTASFNAAQQALSDTMVKYWANFAKNGDPNGAGVPTWAAYTQANDSYQGLDIGTNGVGPLATNFATAHNCTAWNGMVPFTPTP
ncbi:carboxylesterase/lipase family protein [Piscinibacter gummiphilus]|uniref:Carboxylic ester hydrolase n=1 Tax=Piscinibacter gummiphilus TaxID=946333 RepID=A0ABZ0D440_9BURK|nr:carboxylesterase family protein [Piscinibacter gummiphilus]WOB10002.1 carboxylesterase family protein [Piscinibacter gummiphilus]